MRPLAAHTGHNDNQQQQKQNLTEKNSNYNINWQKVTTKYSVKKKEDAQKQRKQDSIQQNAKRAACRPYVLHNEHV